MTVSAALDRSGNDKFGAAGAERLAGVLGQGAALAHLNLSNNRIGDAGAQRLKECGPEGGLDIHQRGLVVHSCSGTLIMSSTIISMPFSLTSRGMRTDI
jgi:hypothetical protein